MKHRRGSHKRRGGRKHRGGANGNSNGGSSCSGWCLPTVLYLALALVGMVMQMSMDGYNETGMMVGHGLYVAFWTGVLYLLCSNCHEGWAWVVLLFPLILTGLMFLLVGSGLVGGLVASAVGENVGQRRHPLQAQDFDMVRRFNIFY